MVDKVEAGKFAVRDAIIFFGICVVASLIYCYVIATDPCTPEIFIFILGALLTAFITFLKQLSGGEGKPLDATLSGLLCKMHFHF